MQARRNINQIDSSDDEQPLARDRSSIYEYQSTAHGLPIDSKTLEDEDRETQPLLDACNVEPTGDAGLLCGRIPSRYILAIWAFFGFFCLYSMRVNLSVAIVAMTAPEHSSNKSAPACPITASNSSNKPTHYEFEWNPQIQGFILGGFFYGYIVTQVIVGNIAEKYGGKWVFGATVLITGLLTLLTPIAARQDYRLLIALRVLMGMCSGPAFPSAAVLWGKWIPPGERSTVPPASQTGTSMGIIFTTPLTSVMIGDNFLGGWPSAFYVFGTLSCIWFIGWAFFGFSSPADHPRISEKERRFLQEHIPQRPKTHRKTPWRHIATCLPVYGIAINHICYNFIYYTLLTTLPTYFSTILNFDLHQSGFLFALPYLAQLIITFISGYIVDRLRARKTFSITTLRRAQAIIGTVGACTFLVAIGYMGCNSTWAVVCCIISVGFLGFHTSGPIISHLDVASNYSGTLVGITNSLATIPGFVGPAIVGAITNNNQTVNAWRIIFNSFAGIGLFGCICFCALFNGEEQPWNRVVDEERLNYDEIDE